MRIKIELSEKSIKNAIEYLNDFKKKATTELPKVFLQKCVDEIIRLANENLMTTDIGSEVKALIQSSWEISPVVANKITLSNTAEFESGKNLAVFVEFGVGRVGGSRPHELANQANYEYNVWSMRKDHYDKWTYTLEGGEDRMNIESGYYEGGATDKGLYFKTAGSPATMFLYKAWKTFETSGAYKHLWELAKAEVIG